MESGTVCGTPLAPPGPLDAGLQTVLERWDNLPDRVRARIVEMVRRAGNESGPESVR